MVDANDRKDNNYYTIVVGHGLCKPQLLTPRRIKRDSRGEPIRSKFGINQFFDEECPRDEIFGEPILKWSTPKPLFDRLTTQQKRVLNSVKSFLFDNQCAVWYHNANSDCMSEFGGRHLHLVLKAGEGVPGTNKLLYNSRRFRAFKSDIEDNGGYVRSQRVRFIEKLIAHLNTQPRVFMGSKSAALEQLVYQVFETGNHGADDYVSCVEDVVDSTCSVAGPSETTWNIDSDDSGESDAGSPRHKRHCESTHEQPICPETSQNNNRGSSSGTSDVPLDIVHLKNTPGDRTINIIKQLCFKFDKWTFEELSEHINGFSATDPIRLRWSTFQHRPGLSQKIQSISQEMKSIWRTKPYDILVTEFFDSAHETLDSYLNPYASLEVLQEWIHHNHLTPHFFGEIQQLMDKEVNKKNCITMIGPSNAGKTVMLQQPMAAICKFVGRVSNVNSASNFAWQDVTNCRLIQIDEALFAPEHLDKYKQISGGEQCVVDKKFSAPVPINRTPVILTANTPPWRTCPEARVPLENRCWFHTVRAAPFLPKYFTAGQSLSPLAYCACHRAYKRSGGCCNENFWEEAKAILHDWHSVAVLRCCETIDLDD